jgi:hypothetical protein
MERIKKLLEVLDFHVSVFDGPDQQSPSDVVFTRIENADLLVVLLGPDRRCPAGTATTPALWPYEEAVLAHGKNKPIAMIVHPGTRIPGMLEARQTPAQFDFWDDTSYADNVHHVVKHLLDGRRSLDLPPGDAPYYYKRVSFKFHVDRRGHVVHDVYHHVVARQKWDTLGHSVDTGPDRTPSAQIALLDREQSELAVTLGSAAHTVAIDWGERQQHIQNYAVKITPPIPEGGQIAYRRRFELENFFP